MGNKERGELIFMFDEKEYILRYDFNDLIIAEGLFQKPIQEILGLIYKKTFGLGDLRNLFYAGILGKRPDGSNLNDLNFEQMELDVRLLTVGYMIESLGGFTAVSALVKEALVMAFPTENGDGKKKKKK